MDNQDGRCGSAAALPGSAPSPTVSVLRTAPANAGCYDPAVDGFDHARLLMVTSRLSAVLANEVAQLGYGAWNPRYCASDAAGRAVALFEKLRKEIDHYEAQARIALAQGMSAEG